MVDVLFNLEQLEHYSDVVRIDVPNVLARTVVGHDLDKGGRRNKSDPCEENHPVVPSNVGVLKVSTS